MSASNMTTSGSKRKISLRGRRDSHAGPETPTKSRREPKNSPPPQHSHVSTQVNSITKSYHVKVAAGGQVNSLPVAFSRDSRFFFCSTASSIKVCNAITGALMGKIFGSSPESRITSMKVDPHNSIQLLTASEDGFIRRWDYSDSQLVRKHRVGHPILMMEPHPKNRNIIYIVTSKKSGIDVLRKCVIQKKGEGCKVTKIAKIRECSGISLSPDGEVIALIGRDRLHIVTFDHDNEPHVRKHKSPNPLTCVAFHPFDPLIATGDSIGQIRIWHGISFETIEAPTVEMMHWHAHEVNCLQFTIDGAYLLSGGEEAVLVFWTLGSGRRRYLPRLGAAISSITSSPDEQFYALTHTDNTVRMVNAMTDEVSEVVVGFKTEYSTQTGEIFAAGLTVEPRNKYAVTNGCEGFLQFYDIEKDQHVFDQEIAPINRVSRINDEEQVITRIDHVAFSNDGRYMSTVDFRDDGETTPELNLKFWDYDAEKLAYNLNTVIQHSHKEPIKNVAFRPGKVVEAVTISSDGTFKLWRVKSSSDKTGSTVCSWGLYATGSYKKLPTSAASYSPDGSLLVVAFGPYVTFWNPNTMDQQVHLSLPDIKDRIVHVSFSSFGSFLVVASVRQLYIFNLLDLTIVWTECLSIKFLTCKPYSNEVAFVSSSDSFDVLYTVDPSSSPKLMSYNVKGRIQGIAYKENTSKETADLIYLSNSLEICQLCTGSLPDEQEREAPTLFWKASEQPSKSTFTNPYGNISSESQKEIVSYGQIRPYKSTAQAVKILKEMPSHIMPPVTVLWDDFMEDVMGTSQVNKRVANVEDTMEYEMNHDDDESKISNGDVQLSASANNVTSIRTEQDDSKLYEQVESKYVQDTSLLNDMFARMLGGHKPDSASPVENGQHHEKSNGKSKKSLINGVSKSLRKPAKGDLRSPKKSPNTTPKKHRKELKEGLKRSVDELED